MKSIQQYIIINTDQERKKGVIIIQELLIKDIYCTVDAFIHSFIIHYTFQYIIFLFLVCSDARLDFLCCLSTALYRIAFMVNVIGIVYL